VHTCSVAAARLHSYLVTAHWRDHKLLGPDPGLRLNYRAFRFVKSALHWLPWADAVCYIQAQGYWILANWQLFDQSCAAHFRAIAQACADSVIALQRPDGGWDYPMREWKGRTATVEGLWGSIGLLATYQHTGEALYLDAVLRWYSYLIEHIGFFQRDDWIAVNYFAHNRRTLVPNNTALLLRFLPDLAQATGDATVLDRCPQLIAFMRSALLPSGEIAYAVSGLEPGERPHFQCYQYNAFQALHLLHYYAVTGDRAIVQILESVFRFLTTGNAEDGSAYYDCAHSQRRVVYHASALAAAFATAGQLGLANDYAPLADRALAYVLRAQRPDGSFPHSRGDYGVLHDNRAYPRYLTMILHHLLTLATPPQIISQTAGGIGQTTGSDLQPLETEWVQCAS
jgi:hypothetical protein